MPALTGAETIWQHDEKSSLHVHLRNIHTVHVRAAIGEVSRAAFGLDDLQTVSVSLAAAAPVTRIEQHACHLEKHWGNFGWPFQLQIVEPWLFSLSKRLKRSQHI